MLVFFAFQTPGKWSKTDTSLKTVSELLSMAAKENPFSLITKERNRENTKSPGIAGKADSLACFRGFVLSRFRDEML